MSTEINKGEWRNWLHSHNFDEGILFQSNLINQSYILRVNLPYTQGFPVETDQGACPLGFSHVLRITRAHQVDELGIDETFLARKDYSGMVFDYLLCVNQGMKAGLRA